MADPEAPLRVLDYRGPASPLPPLPHSGFGQLAIGLAVLTLLCFVGAELLPHVPTLIMALVPTLWITGVVAAIIGFSQRSRRPLFCVIGLAANLAVAAVMVLWMFLTFRP